MDRRIPLVYGWIDRRMHRWMGLWMGFWMGRRVYGVMILWVSILLSE